jgi:hypothetical protein
VERISGSTARAPRGFAAPAARARGPERFPADRKSAAPPWVSARKLFILGSVPTHRLSSGGLDRQLTGQTPRARRIVLALRAAILRTAPESAEGIRFGCLCYFHADARFASIGGNICMIEARGDAVSISFLRGASLPDPHGLLRGRAKAKRFIPIASLDDVENPRISKLIRQSAERRPE